MPASARSARTGPAPFAGSEGVASVTRNWRDAGDKVTPLALFVNLGLPAGNPHTDSWMTMRTGRVAKGGLNESREYFSHGDLHGPGMNDLGA